jgi:rfaE bifunctional protein kinase chain/domain
MKDNLKKTTFVSGNFNILHPGHLRLLRFAKELGTYLIVGVNSDRIAGNAALVNEKLRIEGIQSNNWVDESFIIDESVTDIISKIKPDYVVKGKEHEHLFNIEDSVLNSYGGKLVFSSGEVVFSSMDLIHKVIRQNANSNFKLPEDYLARHSLTLNNLKETIHQFTSLKVIVLGDIIIDEYITCDPLGMSQEDPTIVVTPVESKRFLGGAAIVAAHAKGMGAKVNFISIAGNDVVKDFAVSNLNDLEVECSIFVDESRPTTLKQRFRAKGKTLLRVSHLRQGAIDNNLQEAIYNRIIEIIDDCQLLIFSDFNYGCLPSELVDKIIFYAGRKGILMVADSQSSSQTGDIGRFNDMILLTPTEREARLSVRDMESGLVVLAEKLREKANAQNILLKIGEEGVLVYTKAYNDTNWITDRIPALNFLPVDVAGAGDSMLVSSSLSLATGASIWEAAAIGSLAAAVQVSRIGNIPLKMNELLREIV